jgi:predicted Zn-dependent protease
MYKRRFNTDGAIEAVYTMALKSYELGKYEQCRKLLQPLSMELCSELHEEVITLSLNAMIQINKKRGLENIVRSNPGSKLIN